jgi:hypothetical protein
MILDAPATAVDSPKKRVGWPKGKKRGPRKPLVEASAQATRVVSPVEAPIHVRLRLKDYGEDIEFGCARRLVENGFHVFFYPSRRDPYRETRREFAISQVIEIEITEARPVYQERPGVAFLQHASTSEPTFQSLEPAPPPRPVVHFAKDYAMKKIAEKLEQDGPARINSIPGISFGESLA